MVSFLKQSPLESYALFYSYDMLSCTVRRMFWDAPQLHRYGHLGGYKLSKQNPLMILLSLNKGKNSQRIISGR